MENELVKRVSETRSQCIPYKLIGEMYTPEAILDIVNATLLLVVKDQQNENNSRI